MRIAYDHQVFVQQRFGGISRYFAELASHLHAGNQVTIVAPFHQNEYLLRADVAPLVLGRKLTRGRFISIGRLMRWGNRLALPAAWRGQRPDILHETFFSERSYGQCQARVLTVYDMIHELFPNQLAQTGRIVAAKRVAVARADAGDVFGLEIALAEFRLDFRHQLWLLADRDEDFVESECTFGPCRNGTERHRRRHPRRAFRAGH